MRLTWMRTAVAAAGLALIAAGPAGYAQTIKIGVNEPLTGAVAASGNFVVNGAKIAADEINAKGGILGSKIELVIEDNKSNPTEAVAAAEKLIVRDKVPVMMGAWSSTYTLAVMPKLMEYKVPMLVETSSSDKITVSGNPYVFRIAPTSGMEATAFADRVGTMKIRKADFLVVNNDWGKGSADVFGKMLKDKGVAIGVIETMDASAQDLNAQLAKIRSSDADTLFVTTAVEQLTLVLKQVQALGLKRQIITTGGSQSPDQLIEQAGAAANGSYHLLFFPPWAPEATPNAAAAKSFVAEWRKRGYTFAGLTEGFRGYDGIHTIAAAITKAGKAEPEAIRAALWETQLTGLNGKIAFNKVGPSGKESGQSTAAVYVVKIDSGKVTLVR
ncbi:MAG: transporter substrate-binding protein [Betaproteobacteria bacterium]|nr:transporter substrate-binding protein [Betaproteobacteria bacterium]